MNRSWFYAFVGLALFYNTFARNSDSLLTAKIEKLALEYSFNGTLLIGSPDSIIYTGAFGFSNFESLSKNTDSTIYNIASLSKHFTGAAILLLQERGKLSVNDTLAKYLPEFPSSGQITIHQLLTHSAGIKNYNNFPDYWEFSRQKRTLREVVEWIRKYPPEFLPGEKFSYTNSGYAILAYIIEQVSGMSYSDFLDENFFKPLQMEHTGQFEREDIIPGRAAQYIIDNDTLKNCPWYDISFKAGSGSIFSNVSDMYKWYRALINNKILSPESVDKLFSRYEYGYGYGLGRGKSLFHIYYEHEGSTWGVSAYIAYYLTKERFLVILSNVSPDRVKLFKDELKDIVSGM